MSVVVELARFKKVKKERPGEYFCTRCDQSLFKLLEDGQIRCANCAASMRNLSVYQKRPA